MGTETVWSDVGGFTVATELASEMVEDEDEDDDVEAFGHNPDCAKLNSLRVEGEGPAEDADEAAARAASTSDGVPASLALESTGLTLVLELRFLPMRGRPLCLSVPFASLSRSTPTRPLA
ncbi:hypothetical protein PLEOSDRAFT_1089800 [Pleurotus ostreatus PC15]|uniref:Uncharacterized protein n=1 Tax=Pleurotus ostreatus (strain PC15) TaxID=1137138 RepID=A0A067NR39_PLEO1|nr:hypothetical protein PLEOSDRAFT_1089800 [Pleurotus ostreatus PC15]